MTDGKERAGAGREHAEDLSAHSRRRELSDPERRRLKLCLDSSESLRALHQVGCDFDELDTCRPSDEALMGRVAVRARKRAGARGRVGSVRRRGLALWVGGAVVLAGTLAAAATVLRSAGPASAPSTPEVERPTQPALGERAHRAGGQTKPTDVEARPNERPAAPVSSVANAGARMLTPASPSHAQTSAAVRAEKRASGEHSVSFGPAEADEPSRLFSTANAARRQGALDKSLGIYQELEAQFPGSPEAVLSHVMVGRLHLRRGANTLALVQFGRYLRSEPRGSLAEEALEGKARALQRLGRLNEERAAWQELLSRYPNSIYAEAARERLGGSD